MANINLSKEEIALLRDAVIKKYCDLMDENVEQFTQNLTGTLKHYEYMSAHINDYLNNEDNLIGYFNKIRESTLKVNLKRWLEKDNRYKGLVDRPSVTANILSKLLFYSRKETTSKETGYKDFFVLGCYIFIGIDRSVLLNNAKKPVVPQSVQLGTQKSKTTLPPYPIGIIPVNPGLDGNKRKFIIKPVQNGIKGKAMEFNFNGSDPIVLNRTNLDVENNTITGKIQAQISFTGGKWKIENFSEYNTSYLQILRPVNIQNGDILIFGDKAFLFEEDGS